MKIYERKRKWLKVEVVKVTKKYVELKALTDDNEIDGTYRLAIDDDLTLNWTVTVNIEL